MLLLSGTGQNTMKIDLIILYYLCMYIYQTCVVYERAQIIVVQVQKHSFDINAEN